MPNPVPLPTGERLVLTRNRERYPKFEQQDPNEGRIAKQWAEYFNSLADQVSASARRIHSVTLTDQAGSIAATDVSDATLAAGVYRLSYYVTLVTAATSSSSLTVTLDWTYRGQAKSVSGAAITNNSVAGAQSGTYLISLDGNSPARYATTYSSTGATAMVYDLVVVLERIEA